ncbi:hypothetical protein ACFLZ1_01345 [Patescibacteria group bacterium]
MKKLLKIIIVAFCLIILLIIVLVFSTSYRCHNPPKYKHDFDPMPVHTLQTSFFQNKDSFTVGTWNGVSEGIKDSVVLFEFYEDQVMAREDFEVQESAFAKYNDMLKTGGEGFNQFYVSYAIQGQTGPESFCLPYGNARIDFGFLKSNLFISGTIAFSEKDKRNKIKDQINAYDFEDLNEALVKTIEELK